MTVRLTRKEASECILALEWANERNPGREPIGPLDGWQRVAPSFSGEELAEVLPAFPVRRVRAVENALAFPVFDAVALVVHEPTGRVIDRWTLPYLAHGIRFEWIEVDEPAPSRPSTPPGVDRDDVHGNDRDGHGGDR